MKPFNLTEQEARCLLEALSIAEDESWCGGRRFGSNIDRTQLQDLAGRLGTAAGLNPADVDWLDAD